MSRRFKLLLACVLVVAATAIVSHRLFGGPTFHGDIAPILDANCNRCHHEGGPSPFPLVTYEQARRRGKLIADSMQRRIMPPWMPDAGCEHFVGESTVTADDIARVWAWVEAETPEGKPRGTRPTWTASAAKADLLVTLPQPYMLAAEGRDVYRNFVLPLPLTEKKFVRAVEVLPNGAAAIHHAFVFFDRTGESERRDREDAEPGFPGLHVPTSAQAPPGHFLSWQPGKQLIPEPAGMAWPLRPGASIVLQTHLRPTGKVERVQPAIAFYFTDQAPTKLPVKIGLWSEDIKLPAGEKSTVVKDSMTLPTDVDLLRILPHAHFLARQIEANAALPDGSNRCLLKISNWDFNWQGDYVYRDPIRLPKGTVLSMAFTYDNSAGNPWNPNLPPRDVRYGVQSSDEMAELWMQVLPLSPDGAGKLERELQPKVLKSGVAYNHYLLGLDPNNARAHAELGKALYFQGKVDDAVAEFHESLKLRDDADPHYFLGLVHRVGNRLDAAAAEFRAAIRAQPDHAKAYGNLGLVLVDRGDLAGAEQALERAVQLNPEDEIARGTLAELRARKK